MPSVSMFLGIKILFEFTDHNPPHFHVEYAEFKASVDIQQCAVIAGWLPNRVLRKVLYWADLHQDELMQDWELAREHKELFEIKGLEA